MEKLITLLATWFGCGYSPRAPGTVGTLGALPLAYGLSSCPPLPYIAIVLTFAVVAIGVAHLFEAGGEHDPSEFVLDEVVGFLITMIWIPFHVTAVLAGFVLFRLFDVWKPFPISWIDQRVKGGVGTVADDLVAGIFANIGLQVLLHYHWI